MISPGNYNPPFEWKDGSGQGSIGLVSGTIGLVSWSSPPNPNKGLHATYWGPNEPNLTPLVERSVQIHWNGISGTGKARCSVSCYTAERVAVMLVTS